MATPSATAAPTVPTDAPSGAAPAGAGTATGTEPAQAAARDVSAVASAGTASWTTREVPDGWPQLVIDAFRARSEPLTWNMAVKLAGSVCRQHKIPFGTMTKTKGKQYEAIMLDVFGPGWRRAAQTNERLMQARADVARAEAQSKLEAETADLLVRWW